MLTNPTNMYLFKSTIETLEKKCEICSKLCSDVFIVNLEHISYLFLVPLLLTLGIYLLASKTSKWDVMKFQPSQPSVASHMEISHLICTKNQMVGFYTTRKTWLKWIKRPSQYSRCCKTTWKKYGPKTLLSIEWDNSGKEYAN